MGAAVAAVAPGAGAAAGKAARRAKRDKAKKAGSPGAASKAPVEGMLWGSDLGSQLALDRGVVEFTTSALVPTEPNNPRSATRTQPRAQRVWAPERLSRGRNPMVTPEGLQAAERFMSDWMFAEFGASAGRDDTGVRVDPWARLPYSERRAMCRQSSAMAATKLGPRAMGAVRWCVLQITPNPSVPPTAEEFARSVGWGTERAVAVLGTALDVLAVHYGFTKPSPATIASGRTEGDGT